MTRCAVRGCRNDGLHQFPRDPDLRRQWEKAICRKNFTATKFSRLCRDHFRESDYIGESAHTGRQPLSRQLKKGIIPSLFPWNKEMKGINLKYATKQRKKEVSSHNILNPKMEAKYSRRCVICPEQKSNHYLFRFPLDPERSRQWVQAVGIKDLAYLPKERLHEMKLCGVHFTEDCFSKGGRRLRNYAAPSLRLPYTPLSDEILQGFPESVVTVDGPLIFHNYSIDPQHENKCSTELLVLHLDPGEGQCVQEFEVVEELADSTYLEIENPTVSEKNSAEIHNWTDEETFLLIKCFREENLHLIVRKNEKSAAWQRVYEKLNSVLSANDKENISLEKCKSKMDALRRHYKEIIDQQNETEDKPITWYFFDAMHEMMTSEEWIQPPPGSEKSGKDGRSCLEGVCNKNPAEILNWTTQETFLLIKCFREENVHLIHRKNEKTAAWQRVYEKFNKILSANNNRNISLEKCKSKMDGLRRHYKDIIDHQNKTGDKHTTWCYFDVMHELLVNEEWVEPSSGSGTLDDFGKYVCADSTNSEQEHIIVSDRNPADIHNWSEQETFLLINCFREENLHLLAHKNEKSAAWQRVGEKFNEILSANESKTISLDKCKSKMDGLRRTYKEIINQKNETGNRYITWCYFDAMHELFASEDWVDTSSGAEKTCDTNAPTSRTLLSVCEELLIELRKRNETAIIQHSEKMAGLDRLNNTLESIAQSLAIIAEASKRKGQLIEH